MGIFIAHVTVNRMAMLAVYGATATVSPYRSRYSHLHTPAFRKMFTVSS